MRPAKRASYTFREGLTMMAAKDCGIDPELAAEAGDTATACLNAIRRARKAKSPAQKAEHVRAAQDELRRISPRQHPELVSAIQAKLLALQGRGGDTEIAHVTPGEVVIPRNLQTPAVMRTLAAEALRAGIDPRRYTVGHRANSVNPRTRAGEFLMEPPMRVVGIGPGYSGISMGPALAEDHYAGAAIQDAAATGLNKMVEDARPANPEEVEKNLESKLSKAQLEELKAKLEEATYRMEYGALIVVGGVAVVFNPVTAFLFGVAYGAVYIELNRLGPLIDRAIERAP